MRQLKDLGLIIAYELHGFRYCIKTGLLIGGQSAHKMLYFMSCPGLKGILLLSLYNKNTSTTGGRYAPAGVWRIF